MRPYVFLLLRTRGSQHADVTVLLEDGVAFPPFYFVQGGVHEFLTSVKDRLPLSRAPNDPDLFLIDEQAIKLNHSMETLLPETKEAKRPAAQPIRTKSVADRANEAAWSLLEGFARVANFSLVAKAPAPHPAAQASGVPQDSETDFEVINPTNKVRTPVRCAECELADACCATQPKATEPVPFPAGPAPLPRGPVSEAVWRSMFAADGSCSSVNEKLLRSRIFTDVCSFSSISLTDTTTDRCL